MHHKLEIYFNKIDNLKEQADKELAAMQAKAEKASVVQEKTAAAAAEARRSHDYKGFEEFRQKAEAARKEYDFYEEELFETKTGGYYSTAEGEQDLKEAVRIVEDENRRKFNRLLEIREELHTMYDDACEMNDALTKLNYKIAGVLHTGPSREAERYNLIGLAYTLDDMVQQIDILESQDNNPYFRP